MLGLYSNYLDHPGNVDIDYQMNTGYRLSINTSVPHLGLEFIV